MKYLSILFLLPAIAVSQTFPGAVATNSNLYVASDQATSGLSAAIGASDLSIGVFSASKFRPFNVITIDSEQIKICSIASNILTVCSGGRGFAGTNAVSHNKGTSVANFVSAIYHNTMATELESVEAWLNPGTGVRIGNGTSPVTNLPRLDVPHGGTGLATVTPGALLVGNATSAMQTLSPGAQLTYLRSTPNVVTPAFQSSSLNTIEVPDYNFTAQTPGVSLSAGVVDTITLSPQPLGVKGTDTNHYLYISGGTGAAEAVLIVGGTANGSGSGSGSIAFIPANAHSGAWTIASASDGTQEAINVGFSSGLNVHSPGHTNTRAPISIDITHLKGQTFFGDGPAYWNQTGGTVITNLGTGPAFSLVGDLINNACEASMRLSNFTIHGSPTSGTNISASNACMLRIDHVFTDESQLYGLSCGPNCYTLVVTDSYFYASGKEGVIVSDAANEVHFDRVALQGNCRLAAGISCSGLSVSAASTLAANVTVENSGFALNGNRPIGGFPSSADEAHFFGVNALTFAGNYCEQPLTHCLHIDGATSGFDIRGNYMQQGGINIDVGATSGTITGNRLISGSQVLTITNATNSGGFCRITVSAAPTIPFTVGSFESLIGIGGATACNDTPADNSAVIQSVQSTTQFTTGRIFGGAYTSGGTVEKSSGYSVGGTAGYADIHIFGNSLNTSVGNVLTVGGDLLPGIGANIASSSAISINHQAAIVTGAATIDTMTPPSGFAGQFCALPGGGSWSTSTAGNFANTFTISSNTQKCWTYDPGTSKWY